MLIAHSANSAGVEHDLVDHLRNVADRTASYAGKFSAEELGYWIGLTHDIGKAGGAFQKYIRNPDGYPKVDHKTAGALLVKSCWEGLAFPVAGHHGGLADFVALKQRLQKKESDPEIQRAITLAKKALPELHTIPALAGNLPTHLSNGTQVDMFIRLLFSALVDADFLDTEAHFAEELSSLRDSDDDLSELWKRFEERHRDLIQDTDGPVNALRQEIFALCCQAADLAPGVFRLTVPTGGGKTFSGMAFALRHALRYEMDRVIVAVPYTSIIEQNADEYRKIFGPEAVLEHHSAVEPPENDDEITEAELRMRLAAENWNAPIIVTTTVQLFESLFANRTSRCRKLHNITRSVLILDEVQTLPVELLEPILDVLRNLSDYYGVSVVLCTATQPALDDSPYLRGFRNIREIVPNPERYFELLKRVEYEIPASTEKWSWSRVASVMRGAEQCLTVVNTKKDALALLNALGDSDALHLSTLLCGAHRRKVIAEVKQRLSSGKPCRLVSTQVIEAGVDLDFPLVLRAVGPLDRIVQAAGRCNREGRLTDGQGRSIMGRVIVFAPEDGRGPRGAYASGTDQAASLLAAGEINLHDPALYRRYFKLFYQIVETSGREVQSARESLQFAEVAARFRMIKDNTIPVVVRYTDEVDKLVSSIRSAGGVVRHTMRRLQPYLVNIYEHQLSHLKQEGLIAEITPGLFEWLGAYDPVLGLTQRGRDPETLVF
ncbi:MAG: CRISPR-associated helicase Cas3' [Bacillota bacterium]